MPPYRIRTARPADAAQLPAVERSAGRAFLALPSLEWLAGDAGQPVERHRDWIDGGYALVAVDEDDAPVGFLSAERQGDTLHLWELSVCHAWQGRGIGRALLTQLIATARRRQVAVLTLTTFRDVAWNRPFYETLGFVTLAEPDLPAGLRRILAREAEHGLPPERRCAMRLTLAQEE